MAVRSFSGPRIGPPPLILCLSAEDSRNEQADLLAAREPALAHCFAFHRIASRSARDLPSGFWERLPLAAGVAVDLFDTPQAFDLLSTIATSEARADCPMLARIPDVSRADRPVTLGDFIGFHSRVCQLEKSGVTVWIDGDMDRMENRARNLDSWNFRYRWKAEYPPSPGWIEELLDEFLESALRHHQEIWQPLRIHLNVGFP